MHLCSMMQFFWWHLPPLWCNELGHLNVQVDVIQGRELEVEFRTRVNEGRAHGGFYAFQGGGKMSGMHLCAH